jgi:hypothetical protein
MKEHEIKYFTFLEGIQSPSPRLPVLKKVGHEETVPVGGVNPRLVQALHQGAQLDRLPDQAQGAQKHHLQQKLRAATQKAKRLTLAITAEDHNVGPQKNRRLHALPLALP